MLLLPALFVFSACEPISKDISLGGIVDSSKIKIEAVNATPGSNSIVLRVVTPGITGQWRSGSDIVGVGAEVPLIWPNLGESTFTFIPFGDGGLGEPIETKVTVTVIDVILKSWLLFAGKTNNGQDGKTWVWDTSGGNVYGQGGYGHSKVPNWGGVGVGATTNGHFVDPDASMTFDTDGGLNVTIVNEGVETKGSFSFNAGKAIAGFSIGQLTIMGATIPCGYDYSNGADIPQTFDVLPGKDDNHIVLNWAAPGKIIYDPRWMDMSTMWVFMAEEPAE